jgi:hypothetical protein
LAHSSGEWVKSITPILTKDDSPQAQGSGITYARRYALAAIVGLAQIDDDAEAAQGRKPAPPQVDPDLVTLINGAASVDELNKLFKRLDKAQRMTHIDAFTARKKELSPEVA